MKFATSDIESNDWIKLVAIGFYDGEVYKKFPNIGTYLNYVLQKKYSGYRIYFHNGGKFDFLFLIEPLLDRGYVKFVNKTSGLLQLIYSEKNIRIEFSDSYPLLPASLDKLIETFEIPEKKIEIDFEKGFVYNDSKMQQHLENDCISLYKILQSVYDKEGFLALTVASQAMRNFKDKFFDGFIWQSTKSFDMYFRKNYYKGGRVEVYKGFGKGLNYYDYNSLYPSVMLEEMPSGEPVKVTKFVKNKIGFYHIELKTDTNFGISPFIYRHDKLGNYFINGVKGDKFYLASCEIEFLNDFGIKYKIINGWVFDISLDLFTKYVNHYYEIKVNATNDVERYIAKLMLNSLYGKFGQRLSGQNIEVYNGSKKHQDGIIFDVENDLVLVDTERKVKFRGVYLSSYITSLARIKHLRKMFEIGQDNIWYADTDSIISDKKIDHSNKIGDLKLEHEIKEGCFLLPKTYGFINKKNEQVVHYKGFDSKIFTYKNIKDLLFGNISGLVQTKIRVLGFKECVTRKNGILLSKGTYLKTAEQKKVLEGKYTRRKLINNKKTVFETRPYFIEEIK